MLNLLINLNPLLATQCPEFTSAPTATTLKCTPTLCTAECAPKYKFPKGETTLTTECVNKKWVIKSPKYKDVKELPGCQRKYDLNYLYDLILHSI